MFGYGSDFGLGCHEFPVTMKPRNNYHKGLFFITYLLLNSDQVISDDELAYLHKVRIEEGIDDHVFSEYFNTVLERSEKEIYHAGIEALNSCPEEYKLRAVERLMAMAYADKAFKPRQVRFVLYSLALSQTKLDRILNQYETQYAHA